MVRESVSKIKTRKRKKILPLQKCLDLIFLINVIEVCCHIHTYTVSLSTGIESTDKIDHNVKIGNPKH